MLTELDPRDDWSQVAEVLDSSDSFRAELRRRTEAHRQAIREAYAARLAEARGETAVRLVGAAWVVLTLVLLVRDLVS